VHLTSIGIDHQGWLGDSREKIGFEKAGVLRPNIPVVCNDDLLPQTVTDEIERLGCYCLQYRRDFSINNSDRADQFDWSGSDLRFRLTPPLDGLHQLQNLAGVVAGLSLLLPLDSYEPAEVAENFIGTELMGRFQRLKTCLSAEVFIDVGHNHDAAKALAANLTALKKSSDRVAVLLGMLEDKETAKFVAEFDGVVDEWWVLSLNCDRGLSADKIAERLESVNIKHRFQSAETAINHALSSLSNPDIILVTGSFVTVELFLLALSKLSSN
jgi:dihydrofolate synthase/folylpolyglutamate synthase